MILKINFAKIISQKKNNSNWWKILMFKKMKGCSKQNKFTIQLMSFEKTLKMKFKL